jgi:hypothetical protein
MSIAFKKGTKVRQKIFVIEGEVSGISIVDDDIQYTVDYPGEDGETHQRSFKKSEIEVFPETE